MPEALSSSSSSSPGAWILSQGICLGALVIAEVNALFKDSVAHVMVVLRTGLVSSETLFFRDWVDIHPYLAPDIMSKAITLNIHPVRDETPITVACMVVQASLVQFKRIVNLVISSLIVPVVHSEPATIMEGIRSLKMRRGSNMIMITRIAISQP